MANQKNVNRAFPFINNEKSNIPRPQPLNLKTVALLKKTVPKRARQKHLWLIYEALAAQGYPAIQIKEELKKLKFEGPAPTNEVWRIDALFLLKDMEERIKKLTEINAFKESRLIKRAYNAWSKGLNG